MSELILFLLYSLHYYSNKLEKRNTMKKISFILCLTCLSVSIWAKPVPIKKLILQENVVADSLTEYVGEYTMSASFSTYKITIDGGNLYGEADSYGANKLIKQKETDTFLSTSSYGSTIVFTRDATTKKVKGIKLNLQGNETTGTK